MKNSPISIPLTILAFCLLCLALPGCSDKSDNIPNSYEDIEALMQQGWALYNAGNFTAATSSFREANQRNALYLPAYNALGWSAVRQTNFTDAEVQFSFVTTLANPQTQVDLLADTYAGLSLSSAIERSVLELGGQTSLAQLAALAQESIDRTGMVFALKGENYLPAEHDAGFGSHSLHLLNAQHYFYLQDYANSEAQLSIVDPAFVPAQLAIYGQTATDVTIPLSLVEAGGDTTWFLVIPANQPQGIHHISQIVPPNPNLNLTYQVQYSQNQIQVFPEPDSPLQDGMNFTVSYIYITNFSEYLYHLIEHIQELIAS
jgi:hypothetical protein